MEWRLFLPSSALGNPYAREAQETVATLVDGAATKTRTDVYFKADCTLGVKRRGKENLELKILLDTIKLDGGAGPGSAESYIKIKLGKKKSLSDALLRLQQHGRFVDHLLEAFANPTKVEIAKVIRKQKVEVGEHAVSLEYTGISVRFPEAVNPNWESWVTFCIEGDVDDIHSFLVGKGKPLADLFSFDYTMCVGYPEFVCRLIFE
ncbi:unnamed protein product [Choristocarpus tenellus]